MHRVQHQSVAGAVQVAAQRDYAASKSDSLEGDFAWRKKAGLERLQAGRELAVYHFTAEEEVHLSGAQAGPRSKKARPGGFRRRLPRGFP